MFLLCHAVEQAVPQQIVRHGHIEQHTHSQTCSLLTPEAKRKHPRPGLTKKNTTQNFSEDDEHFALLHHEVQQQAKLPSCSDLSYTEYKSLKPWGSPVQSNTDLSVWILLLASICWNLGWSFPLMLRQSCQKRSNSSSTTGATTIVIKVPWMFFFFQKVELNISHYLSTALFVPSDHSMELYNQA